MVLDIIRFKDSYNSKIRVNNLLNYFFHILDKSLEGSKTTLHTFGRPALQISRNIKAISSPYILDKSLEGSKTTLHTFGRPALQISRVLKFRIGGVING